MSEPSDKEQIYAITRFLDGLSDGQSATAKATIAELNTKLSSIFSTDLTNVNDFLALDYGSDVSSILEAGAKSLNVSTFCVFISCCCSPRIEIASYELRMSAFNCFCWPFACMCSLLSLFTYDISPCLLLPAFLWLFC